MAYYYEAMIAGRIGVGEEVGPLVVHSVVVDYLVVTWALGRHIRVVGLASHRVPGGTGRERRG